MEILLLDTKQINFSITTACMRMLTDATQILINRWGTCEPSESIAARNKQSRNMNEYLYERGVFLFGFDQSTAEENVIWQGSEIFGTKVH